MLENATLYAVFPAKDVERLKRFFSEKLGLDPVNEQMGMPFYEVGGAKFFIYESTFAGTNEATAAMFDVEDVEAVVEDLKDKGVTFEHYDLPGTSLDGDIHTMEGSPMKSAWFKDTEGNIINLNQSK